MIDINVLFKEFSTHVATCKSAPFVCAVHASFESWFRVELVPVLWGLRYPAESVETNYTYPDSRDKADLCVKTPQGNIVFELKTFVSGQDSNKKSEYPRQINKLERLIADPSVRQVITFTTFIGYSELRMRNYMHRFFTSGAWEISGPTKFFNQYPLYVAITSIKK